MKWLGLKGLKFAKKVCKYPKMFYPLIFSWGMRGGVGGGEGRANVEHLDLVLNFSSNKFNLSVN